MVQLPSPTPQVGSSEVHDLEAECLPFLPKSVLAEIFSRLLPVDLVNLAAACSTLRQFLLLPASTSIWARVHVNKALLAHATPAEPDRFIDAHPHLLLLRDSYYNTIDSHDALRSGMPPFCDLASLHGVRKRLEAATTDADVLSITAWLVNAVKTWRNRARNQLVRLLPPVFQNSTKSLPLATCVFRRGSDPRPLFYPDMMMGDPYSIKDPARAGPDKELVYCAQSAAVVQQICYLSKHQVMQTTHAQLDASPLRFCCLNCDPEWSLVLDWRQALEHASTEHDGQSISLAKWPSNTAERAMRNDESVASWVCLKCPSSRHGLLSRPAMRLHISESHAILLPAEGRQFMRAPGAPVPKPLTVLQLHAEEIVCTVLDDLPDPTSVLWKCLHCALLFEGPSALGLLEDHLNNIHHVVLRIPRDETVEVNLPLSQHLLAQPLQGSSLGLQLAALGSLDYGSPATLPAPTFPVEHPVAAVMRTPFSGIPTQPATTSAQPSKPTLSGKPKQAPSLKATPAPAKLQVSTVSVMLPNGARGKVRLASSDKKIYGCRYCTSSPARLFALPGIKQHLLNKHNNAIPTLEVDFFVDGGPEMQSCVTLLPL